MIPLKRRFMAPFGIDSSFIGELDKVSEGNGFCSNGTFLYMCDSRIIFCSALIKLLERSISGLAK